VPPRGPARVDPAAPATVEAALARIEHHLASVAPAGRRGVLAGLDAAALRRRWADLAALADPRPLTARADALREAADAVRRQHVDTAEDLGPLWDTWAGPDAEAVQRRMSSLARSAQALVGELAATADLLDDAASAVVSTVHDLANRAHAVNQTLDEPTLAAFLAALRAAGEHCAAAWARAERPPRA
jgi:uncharacterized protein YukE